ncbi:MAG: hypothetical protein A2265_01800 [Bacteroidetes bacterium RIFOXYA12_FULL_33_9]|nr:MAG: hypothetical protein A2265_01800 [Bacteroidetes bacterium RIFOXYA12_FULL_33_9]
MVLTQSTQSKTQSSTEKIKNSVLQSPLLSFRGKHSDEKFPAFNFAKVRIKDLCFSNESLHYFTTLAKFYEQGKQIDKKSPMLSFRGKRSDEKSHSLTFANYPLSHFKTLVTINKQDSSQEIRNDSPLCTTSFQSPTMSFQSPPLSFRGKRSDEKSIKTVKKIILNPMKNFTKTFLIIGMLGFSIFANAQSELNTPKAIERNATTVSDKAGEYKLQFSDIKEENENKIVSFYISAIESPIKRKELYTSLLNDSKIHKVDINEDNLCKATIANDVTPEYILEILRKNSLDFLYKGDIISIPIKTKKTTVQPFAFDAEKTYENNRRIAYFTLEGIESKEQVYLLQKRMPEINKIYRFQNADNRSINRFMIECDSDINETFILEQINAILANSIE